LLVDVSLGLSLESWIRESGHDAVFVREIDPRLSDSAILQQAQQEDRIVVTMDKDFGELVFRSQHPHRGVLLLRFEEQSASASVPILSEILERHAARLQGSFAVYQNGHLRIRRRQHGATTPVRPVRGSEGSTDVSISSVRAPFAAFPFPK
jgi:predicted nuclease of predicted toxin-antitoxin system